MSDAKNIPKHIVCIGFAETTSGKVSPEFREVLEGDKLDDKPRIWNKLKAEVGAVYQIETSNDDDWSAGRAFIPKSGRLTRTRVWPDVDERSRWQAQERAENAERLAEKMKDNQLKEDDVKRACEQLARHYSKMPWNAHTAFLVAVQEQIVRSSRRF